jgi:hypothetical protein
MGKDFALDAKAFAHRCDDPLAQHAFSQWVAFPLAFRRPSL